MFSYFTCDFNKIIIRRMKDISRFFDRNSKKKKKNLNINSKEDETSKKPREGCLITSTSRGIPDDLFTESLENPDSVTILPNRKEMTEKKS